MDNPCSSEWPAWAIGWPRDRTFDLSTILGIKGKVFEKSSHGHLDQIPYILTWERLASDPPGWVSPFLSVKKNVTLPLPVDQPGEVSSSSLYPTLTKTPRKPVLPPDDNLFIDLLNEDPPPYQAPPAAPPQL